MKLKKRAIRELLLQNDMWERLSGRMAFQSGRMLDSIDNA